MEAFILVDMKQWQTVLEAKAVKETQQQLLEVNANLPVYNYVTRDETITIAERIYEEKSRLCSSMEMDNKSLPKKVALILHVGGDLGMSALPFHQVFVVATVQAIPWLQLA